MRQTPSIAQSEVMPVLLSESTLTDVQELKRKQDTVQHVNFWFLLPKSLGANDMLTDTKIQFSGSIF